MVATQELTAIWDKLNEHDRDTLFVFARAIQGGVFQTQGLLVLVPFSTPQLREAFHRLHQHPDTVSILLTFPRGGGQAVKGIDATGRAREEDGMRSARRAG